MKYFSMFSGIGGFELGLQRVGVKSQNSTNNSSATPQHPLSPLCVGYSEIDKYAIKVYERHFGHESHNKPQNEQLQAQQNMRGDNSNQLQRTTAGSGSKGHKNYGDATTINPKELPDFELLVGGFPCQAFSVAGKRKGFDDTRGTLFFDIARILAEKRPRHLVLENVKGLLSHDAGKTFQTILGVLSDLGYIVEWQVLNSKDFGVPQNRERVFIVGHLRGGCGSKVFPITGNNPKVIEQGLVTVSAVSGVKNTKLSPTLDTMYKKGLGSKQARPAVRQLNNPTHSNDRVYGDKGLSPTLNTMQGGMRQPKIRVQEATKQGYAEASVGQVINLALPKSKTRRGRVSDVAQTVDTGMQQHTLTPDARVRRLTPKECERLQGFPDDWTAGESDTQRYKMCGNAVTVNVVEAVVHGLVPCLVP